jgi:hypothetical protein
MGRMAVGRWRWGSGSRRVLVGACAGSGCVCWQWVRGSRRELRSTACHLPAAAGVRAGLDSSSARHRQTSTEWSARAAIQLRLRPWHSTRPTAPSLRAMVRVGLGCHVGQRRHGRRRRAGLRETDTEWSVGDAIRLRSQHLRSTQPTAAPWVPPRGSWLSGKARSQPSHLAKINGNSGKGEAFDGQRAPHNPAFLRALVTRELRRRVPCEGWAGLGRCRSGRCRSGSPARSATCRRLSGRQDNHYRLPLALSRQADRRCTRCGDALANSSRSTSRKVDEGDKPPDGVGSGSVRAYYGAATLRRTRQDQQG